jgi:MFS family permease
MLFCGLVLIGQVVFSIGLEYRIYAVCLAGRFIFGLGGESLTVGQNYYTNQWFDGKILATVFGIVLAMSRVGSSINFAITPLFANIGVPFSAYAGTVMCLFSFICCAYLSFMDWYGEARIKKREKEVISLLYIRFFPLQSWLTFLICVFFYMSVLTFYTVASDIMQNTGRKWGDNEATFFLFIPNFVAIPAAPFFGYMIDKRGRSLWWLLLACVMQVCAHIVFLALSLDWIDLHPAVVMVWIGIGYSIFASAIWPLLPFIIKENMLGTGFGTMTAIQNAGLAIGPQVIGAVQTTHGIEGTVFEYIIPLFIFIGCAAVSFVFAFILMTVDRRRTGGVLNGDGVAKTEFRRKMNAIEDK